MTTASPGSPDLPWLEGASLFASGRDALAALVRWGAHRHGWRRVWLPGYNCPEVPAALLTAVGDAVELRAYPDAELDAAADLDAVAAAAGDVAVVVNQLGVRPRPRLDGLRDRGVVVVEDHSHDPASAWALGSDADYAFASLRKTLPIPDGGAVWSPPGLEPPPEPEADGHDADRRPAARLAAALSARRLRLEPQEPLRYRALARAAAGPSEPAPGAPISPVSRSLVRQMPVRAWRERRRANVAILAEAAASAPGVRVLRAPEGGVAFALTLLFDDAGAREAARRSLVARAVVPIVLWDLLPGRDWGAEPADAALSSRILSVHGDQRFDGDDMRRLAAILREALGG